MGRRGRALVEPWAWLVLALLRSHLGLAQDDDEGDGGDDGKASSDKSANRANNKGGHAPGSDLDDDEGPSAADGEPWIDPDDYGYALFLLVLCVLCLLLIQKLWKSGISSVSASLSRKEKKSPEFHTFQKQFLLGYALNVAADWMQGPYVYKLYSFYGFSKGEIGSLFVAGFFSSMVFGTIVAGLADRFGRRRMCLVYAIVYFSSCLTKHSTDYWVLFGGRLLAGIAASILHSSFESWYIAQHKAENYPDELMVETLAWMSFVKGFVAIAAAVISSAVANRFGFVAPFDAAAILLALGGAWVNLRWKENYGDRSAGATSSFGRAMVVLAVNPKVWLLGFIQSGFEGAMYIFVFSWTPVLEATSAGEDLPHGLVFGCFMVSIMIGSNLSHFLLTTHPTEMVTASACAIAAISLFASGLYESHYVVLFAFCLFEACVGVYFPAIASQRAKHIPNEVRATIMGFFRIPLNLIVVLVLLNAAQVGTFKLSTISTGLLGLAFVGQRILSFVSTGQDAKENATAGDNNSKEALA